MKKWLIALAVIIVLIIGCSYIFIGKELTISKVAVIKCKPHTATRVMRNERTWKKWWPGTTKENNTFSYNNDAYQVTTILDNSFHILIGHERDTVSSMLTIIPLNNDSIAAQWKCSFPTSVNPLKRIKRYQEAIAIKKNMDGIVNALQSFLSKKESIYRFNIQKASVIDTILLSAKSVFPSYPGIDDVYSLIKKVQDYATAQHAKQTGYPMMHVTRKDSTHFELMVAIPTDRELSGNNTMAYKRMVPGPILMAEVKGGPATIAEAYTELENFKSDHNITSPAIPFESMITDRSRERDSAKWVTRVYYPVIPF